MRYLLILVFLCLTTSLGYTNSTVLIVNAWCVTGDCDFFKTFIDDLHSPEGRQLQEQLSNLTKYERSQFVVAWRTVSSNSVLRKDPAVLSIVSKYIAEVGDTPSSLRIIFDKIPSGDQRAFLDALEDVVDFSKSAGKQLKVKLNMDLLKASQGAQGSGAYPGVDNWIIVEIPKGTKIYGGVPGQSSFYLSYETLSEVKLSKSEVWKSLQVAPHPEFGYRSKIAEYELNSTYDISFSKVTANPQHGNGGGYQYFVDEFEIQLRATGKIIDLE